MKAKIVAKETIKPCSPTPNSFKLSILDQLMAPFYIKVYFFYENTCSDDIKEVVVKRTQRLKSSLSQVLTRFYPFVGRIRDQMTISFHEDDGAEFVEAKIDSTLKEYLENPNYERYLHLVPDDHLDKEGTRPLHMVQANFFKCGGLAIGMNFSHKVSDTSTFTTFINAWADTAIGKSPDTVKSPELSSSLVFPPVKEFLISGERCGDSVQLNNKRKRFVFTATKLAALQETATNESIPWTSRTEIVTTFIWRIRMKMSIKRAGGSPVPSYLLTPVNIRKLLPPPITEQTFGNLVETQIVRNESGEIELSYLINLYREEVKKSREAYKIILDEQRFMERFMVLNEKVPELMTQPEVKNAIFISSWNKFPFYENDFGWGKPIWVATHNPGPYNTVLMDMKDSMGIEAWVILPEEQMDIFSRDEELLKYAVVDPDPL